MTGTVIYETKAKWRPYLILGNNVVEYDKFEPFYENIDGEAHIVYFQSDPKLEEILIKTIRDRMAEIGVDPDDSTKTVSFAKQGVPSYKGRSIESFINGPLRHYVYNHWLYSFEALITAIKTMNPRSFCVKADEWNPEEFVLTVNRPIYRRAAGNKNTKTFDFIDIEMVIRSTDADKRKVLENKAEIFNKAIEKLETSKQFQKYGVPINFLKMYQFVVRKDGTLIISFCMKGDR